MGFTMKLCVQTTKNKLQNRKPSIKLTFQHNRGGGSSSPTQEVLPIASLPGDVQDLILAYLPYEVIIQVSQPYGSFQWVTQRSTFQYARLRLCPTECSLSSLIFSVERGVWHVIGFDSRSSKWRRLPPLRCLPAPDPELFKDFLVAGGAGLLVVNVAKSPDHEKLIVCNPLTQETRGLPPLHYRRHPVVMHVQVNLALNTYKVIVAGSSGIGTEAFSRKTEVFDSATGKWVVLGDVPGPDFALNEYQTGAFCKSRNLLFCVGFLDKGGKGVLVYNVEQGEWLSMWHCPLPEFPSRPTTYFAITQLLECNDAIYLFSEQEYGRDVFHFVDKLDPESTVDTRWTTVVKVSRKGNRALLVYPEYTCVPHAENKLCIFNTVERTGVVYEIPDTKAQESLLPHETPDTKGQELLPPPPSRSGIMFHSLNPLSYLFEPSLGISVKVGDGGLQSGLKGL